MATLCPVTCDTDPATLDAPWLAEPAADAPQELMNVLALAVRSGHTLQWSQLVQRLWHDGCALRLDASV